MLLQVLLAITLVIIFFIVGFSIYNLEFVKSIRKSGMTKSAVQVFKGVKDMYMTTNEVYNTQDKSSSSYRPLELSYNQPAGAEFTYNFWLYMDATKAYPSGCVASTEKAADSGFKTTTTGANGGKPLVLFLKGNPTLGTYKNICNNDKLDVLVKGPLVKLEQCGKNLTVEFNTVQSPDITSENSPDLCSTSTNASWASANAHKVTLTGINDTKFDKKWNMITIIIQDTYPNDPQPIRNKVRCRIYVNGLLELDRYVNNSIAGTFASQTASLLKQNDGHLHINPVISSTIDATVTTTKPNGEKGVMMADLAYFNYALEANEINTLFDAKFTKTVATAPGADNITSADEIYNYAAKPSTKQFTAFS